MLLQLGRYKQLVDISRMHVLTFRQVKWWLFPFLWMATWSAALMLSQSSLWYIMWDLTLAQVIIELI